MMTIMIMMMAMIMIMMTAMIMIMMTAMIMIMMTAMIMMILSLVHLSNLLMLKPKERGNFFSKVPKNGPMLLVYYPFKSLGSSIFFFLNM